jgi:tetratricopeptide (TPR) repeat protein
MHDVVSPFHAYLSLAEGLFEGRISESDLQPAASALPNLDNNLLETLAQYANGFASIKPRYGWAIAQVAHDAAASQNCDSFLQSLAAWYLGRACNHWARPKRVQQALSIARRGFEDLNDAGWVAACDWQLNGLPWTRPNFAQAAQTLQQSMGHLERFGLVEFVPDCRLAVAYAQILIGEHDAALENIGLSEEAYLTCGDKLNQARCWLTQAASLRRLNRFDEAFQLLNEALKVFDSENALADSAKAHYQIALGCLLKADDLPLATDQFQKAIELFETTDLDLWRAMCVNNLGSVYLITGQLKLAEEHYQEARTHFVRHEIQGLLADNLNDSGKLNILMGKPALSVEQFEQCEAINDRLDSRLSATIAISNLGEAYGQLGRYQDALYHLERAAESLEALENHFRLATCEKYMALIWTRLGRPQLAHEFLDRAAIHYERADQQALLSSVYNYRAAAFFQQGQRNEAIKSLEQSLDIAEKHKMSPQAALAKRILGEALIPTERSVEALKYLEQARSEFAGMGMSMEQAACMIPIGTYFQSVSEPDKARAAFDAALQLSEKTFPEADWRAHIGLGSLAEAQGQADLAIHHYRLGTVAFAQIRRNFLQPTLAGSYLQEPARVFDRIITLSAKMDIAQDTLYFIEETKDSTLIRNLSMVRAIQGDSSSQELDNLKAEINVLQNRLRVSLDEMSPLQSALHVRQTKDRLIEMIEEYDVLKTRLERRSFPDEASMRFSTSFNLGLFREKASSFLPDDWVALDYYMTGSDLIIVIVTPHACRVLSQPVSKRFTMALGACEKARRNGEPPLESDLEILGKLLIPASVAEQLLPGAYLLIAPHRALHQVPWPALRPDFSTQPLVCVSTPCVVPSLYGLMLLWERTESGRAPDRKKGLLVGLSSFNGVHKELPLIKEEIAILSSKLGPGSCVLAETDATWENLLGLRIKEEPGWEGAALTRFAWLHMASHFFLDRHTGRLSGIAFRDGDIWLDQLRDLSPLPGLISLSACNSNDSFLYEGDERVDLQTTCFLAGANTVVGSIWPVPDHAAGDLMALFYDHFLSGSSPAKAAALAHRQFIADGKELKSWASFVCAGKP